uniref:Uncharacterized protein n=2 Tax=Pandoraea faecigallinarum TaxID=656179 RepID=A0A0H3WV17_9BURK
MVFVDRTGGDEARHEAIRAHTIQQFGDLAETACGILDEPVESGPALGLLLSLAERGVPPEVLACLDIERIDRLAQLTESQPVLGACCLTMLAERLGALAPSETVEDIFDYLFRNSTLRSLERSLVRAGVRAPGTCRVGGEWRHDFRRWRDSILRALQDFRWLGSGHDARGLPAYDVDPAIMRESAMATPALNFTRSGKTGWLLAMVYAGSLYNALPAPLCPRLATPFEPGSTPRGATSQGADLSRGVSSTGSRGRIETSLHTAGHVLAEISRQMSAMGAGLPGRILSVLEYVSTYVQIPLLPGAQGASLPADREIWTTLVSSLPAQSNTTTALPRPSPEIKRLTESANVWRQRAALHGELSHRFEALLHFEPPVSEEALFEARLASRPELAGVNLSELTLRRHSRTANHQRLVKVRYWPLLVAAREIAEGKLDIVSPRDGVSFDVCLPTPAGAIYETPSLMGAERFHALVTD